MSDIFVSTLFWAYIKGARGIWKSSPGEFAEVDQWGIKYDRRFVVVDEHGNFVAGRQGSVRLPFGVSLSVPSRFGAGVAIRSMCLIGSRIENGELVITAQDMKDLRVSATEISGGQEQVKIWRDPPAVGVYQGGEAEEWFTQFLSRERKGSYHLLRMKDDSYRPSKFGGAKMGFHDGFPFMMMSDATLGQLNGKLLAKGVGVVTADRFRPNVWLRGSVAHAEDHFASIQIGNILFEGQTLCDRCSVICTDQATGVVSKEPNATLVGYRRGTHLGLTGELANKIYMGRNFVHLNTGVLRVGDAVSVMELD